MTDYPEVRFAEIQTAVPVDLSDRVLSILQQHVGRDHRISRRALVEQAFRVAVDDNLANSTQDRQVRMILEDLQAIHPILSTSGGGGYYYAGSAEEISRYAAELDSRAKKLLQKSRRLLKLARRFNADIQLNLPNF